MELAVFAAEKALDFYLDEYPKHVKCGQAIDIAKKWLSSVASERSHVRKLQDDARIISDVMIYDSINMPCIMMTKNMLKCAANAVQSVIGNDQMALSCALYAINYSVDVLMAFADPVRADIIKEYIRNKCEIWVQNRLNVMEEKETNNAPV